MIRYHLCKTELQAPASTPEGRRRWVVDLRNANDYGARNKRGRKRNGKSRESKRVSGRQKAIHRRCHGDDKAYITSWNICQQRIKRNF